jgi:uncharacterized repeat protein (TIGR01451 family)
LYLAGAYGVDMVNSYGPGAFTIPSPATVLSDAFYATAGSAVGATIAENGLSASASFANGVVAATQFEIGARTTGGLPARLFSGSIDEIVYYKSSALTATKISQIRSYLAVKYGITLGYNAQTGVAAPTDYVNSSGNVIWPSATNSSYRHNVFGVGRDDASGLSQLESNSSTLAQSGSSFNMTVANGSSPTTPSTFATDQTYLMLGDNGLATTMSNHSGIYRMARVWLGQLSKPTSQIYFQMPASAFTGVPNPAIWVWGPTGLTSSPIYNQALTCNTTICYVVVPAGGSGAYYFSFGQLQISGNVFEDVNYGGGAGRALAAASGAALSGARVELYKGGAFSSSTTTAADGSYLFLVNPSTSYVVRAVTPTTSTRTGGSTAGLIAVQTYRTDAGTGSVLAVTDHVGGETPGLVDASANTTNATLAGLTTAATTPQSITTSAVPATAGILGLNFGFYFGTVVNANAGGQGSLAQFITNADALGGVASLLQANQTAGKQTSIFMIGDGTASRAGLHAGTKLVTSSNVAAIAVSSALPAITNAGTVIDGTTQTTNVATNSGSWGTGGTVGTVSTALATISRPTVQVVGVSSIATGLSITASNVTIRGLAISGFGSGATSAQIAVTGSATSGSLIEKNVIGTSATTFEIRSAQSSAANPGVSLASTTASTISANLITANPASGIATSGTSGTLTITNNTISANGVSISGSAPVQTPAIVLVGTSSTVSQNVINANYGAGILVANGATQNTISQNSIYANGTVTAANGAAASGEIGIDLANAADAAGTGTAPYITPNRSGGIGTGGDNLFNFPVIDAASIVGGNLILTGYARAGATIEVFIADTATTPASGFGQGKTYVTTLTEGAASGIADTASATGTYANPRGNENVGTDTANRFYFSLPAPGSVSVGSVLTAVEYLAANGTSEFGPNITVVNAAPGPAIATLLSVSPSGIQPPGTVLRYTGAFTNSGLLPAYNVSIVDPIPSNTDFQIGSVATTLTNTTLTYAVQYSNDTNLTTSGWSYTPVSGAGGAPANYDRTVTGVKFTFSGSLDYNSPANTGSFSLAVRIQ